MTRRVLALGGSVSLSLSLSVSVSLPSPSTCARFGPAGMRFVHRAGECNFHIFYYLFGSPDAGAMGLSRPDAFPYTAGEDPQQRQARCVRVCAVIQPWHACLCRCAFVVVMFDIDENPVLFEAVLCHKMYFVPLS